MHLGALGRRVEEIADLQRVRGLRGGRIVADHERAWDNHQSIPAAEHVTAAKALRAARVGLLLRPAPPAEVEIRPLSDYDAALGLTDGGVA